MQQDTFIGYAIEVSFIQLMNEFMPEKKVDPKLFNNNGNNSDDDIYELYNDLESYLCNKLTWGLKLEILKHPHYESQETCFFGIFVPVNDDFGMHTLSQKKYNQIVHLQNDVFKNKCEQIFQITPTLCTVMCGCNCCT